MPAKPATSWHSLAFLIAFILLVSLGWQGKRSQEALLETNQSVNQSLEIITATQAILSSLQDIETGTRGFILTGEPAYLEPYEHGLEQLEQNRRRLQVLANDHAYPAPPWFERLDEKMADRLMIAADNIQTRRDADLQTAAAYLAQAGGKDVMDHLRILLAAVEQQERQSLAAGNRAVAETVDRNRQFALVGSVLVAILFLAALWSVQRNLRLRQALAAKAQAGEARVGALLQAIPDDLFAIDDHHHVTALSQPNDRRPPSSETIEPLLAALMTQADDPRVGHTIWCEIDQRRVFEVRLVPTGFGEHLAIARDITELQRSRDDLEDQKTYMRRVADTNENLIFVRDEEGRFLFCNRAFSALLDLSPEAIERHRIDEIAGAQLLLPLLKNEDELLGGNGELRTTDVSVTDVHGQERWLQVVKRPMALSGGACHIVTVAVDISLRRRVEQMKSEFISSVSHELRTPLTAIRGALGMLVGEMAGEIGDGARPLLNVAHKNSERLVRLINDILDIEKLEAGRLTFHCRRCDVRALAAQALLDIKPYADDYGVSLTLTAPDETTPIEANVDPDRFAQIMANLLSNAIKHSPRGGVVSVDLHAEGSRMEIGIRDQGPGIPESFRSRIFERFAQADSSDARKRGGTGLGLAITRSLVQQMEGQVGFESQEGQGTRFWLQLPLPAQPANPSAAPQPSLAGANRAAARVLVLEPDKPAAGQMAGVLQQHGYATLIAASVGQARELLAEYRIQALILSPTLSDEEGIAFLQDLRSQRDYHHLPILIVSLQPQRRDQGGGAVGEVDWLHKPIEPTRLMALVRACLDNHGARPRILHVEDDENLRGLLARQVAPLELDLQCATTLAEARERIAAQRYDLAIIDLMLPDGNGSELFDRLAQSVPAPPVIIFSALSKPVRDGRLTVPQLVRSRHDGRELATLIQHMLQHWPAGLNPESDEAHA